MSMNAQIKRNVFEFWKANGLDLNPVTLQDKLKEYTPWKTVEDCPSYRTMHYGQRKLFLTELMFLSLVSNPKQQSIVVYAGAAPADHIWTLISCFPFIRFILIDPERWNKRFCDLQPALKQTSYRFSNQNRYKIHDRIEVIHGYMTDDLAKTLSTMYKNTDLFFISDIRPTDVDHSVSTIQERNSIIKNNMDMQSQWLKLLNQNRKNKIWAIFKFKPNFSESVTKYYKGFLFYQPWAPLRSTELRLITDNDEDIINYDNTLVEKHMAWYNDFFRNHVIERNELTGIPDSILENCICKYFLKHFSSSFSQDNQLMFQKQLSNSLDNKDLHFGLYCFEKNWVPNVLQVKDAISKIIQRDQKYTNT
jgi:hypothetical protein